MARPRNFLRPECCVAHEAQNGCCSECGGMIYHWHPNGTAPDSEDNKHWRIQDGTARCLRCHQKLARGSLRAAREKTGTAA